MLTVGSLFAGIGGMELGLEWTGGFETVWQVENDDYARRVLEKHWPNVRRWGDVTTFLADAECEGLAVRQGEPQDDGKKRPTAERSCSEWQCDLICGGFPCQPVSCAGKRAGESDERWLWDEMRRVCEILRPRWVLAENVPGLMSAGTFRGELFGKVVRDLASLGYCVEWDCIPAAAVGAPHIRDRVFILAHADGCEQGRWEQQERRPQRRDTDVAGNGEGRNVGDTTSTSEDTYAEAGRPRDAVGESGGESRDVADALSERQPGRGAAFSRSAKPASCSEEPNWWSTEPDVGRVAHGVRSRVDRLRCLGNAVVPAVAQYIGEMILAMEQRAPNP